MRLGVRVPATDRQAFITEIATKHGSRLRRFLAARLRNAADVSDLTQEVFLRLLRVDRHESIRNPEAYVITVASHVLHQHMLRGAVTPQPMDAVEVLLDLQSTMESDPGTQLDARRHLEEIDRVLLTLPHKARATFVLNRRDGLTLEEIGKQLGVSRPMVKKYLVRALAACRNHRDLDKD